MWRRFQFFDKKPLEASKELSRLSCPSSTAGVGPGGVRLFFFASENGLVYIADVQLKLVSAFRSHDVRCTFVKCLNRHRNVVITVGEDDPSAPLASTSVKARAHSASRTKHSVTVVGHIIPGTDSEPRSLQIWDADRLQLHEKDAAPPLVQTVKLFAPKFPEAPIITFDAVEDGATHLTCFAGLTNGHVYVERAELARDRVNRSRVVVQGDGDGPTGAVTGIGIRTEGTRSHLFASTSTQVVGCELGTSSPKLAVLDAHGCAALCACSSGAQEFVVGRSEGVYFYGSEGREQCLAFPGEKRQLSAFGGYLMVLASGPPGTVASSQISLYDLRNKLIAYQSQQGAVSHVMCVPGCVTVLQTDGSAFALVEKDLPSKLELLFRKSLYGIAISLIQAEGGTEAAVAEVRRRLADHLYAKQDYDGAMAQYVQTIGFVEPSYVVRLFLDARRIDNLTAFLEALHSRGEATADHTTLLLNCYTKLKVVAKLDAFLSAGDAGETPEQYRERFDVHTVLKVCRSAGYHDHALQVAARAGIVDAQLSIMLEDLGLSDRALAFLQTLPAKDAEATLRQYGRLLLNARPAQTVSVIIKLCRQDRGAACLRRAAALIIIFVDRPRLLLETLQTVVDVAGPLEETQAAREAEATVQNTILELLLQERLVDAPPREDAPAGPSAAHAAAAASAGARPQSPAGGEGGRRKGAAARPGPGPGAGEADRDKGPPDPEAEADKARRRAAALELLKNGWPQGGAPRYDPDHAVVLCKLHRFQPGMLLLFERLKLYHEVLRCYMEAGDHRGLIVNAARLGQHDPNLWLEVLSYLAARQQDCSAEVREALAHIERGRLLPPLVVLQQLAKNPRLPLSVAKDFISRSLAEEQRATEEDRAAISRYVEETAAMKSEVRDLKTQARVFQNNRCSACQAPLDLPAVHFLCMHSFHQRCLGDNERECVKCAPENRTVMEIKRSLEASAADQDKFFQELEDSVDGFGVIAEHFGRGMLNNVQSKRQPPQPQL